MKPILVIDDEFDISEVISSILQADGYTVKTCANGRDAIAYLRDNPAPQLVIVDVMMPFVDGYGVIEFMKKTASLKATPIILMSAFPPAKSSKESGWSSFLRKPFNLDDLVTLVGKHVRALRRESTA